MDAELLTSAEVARRLRISTRSLSTLVVTNQGPPFVQFRGTRRYPRDELDRWLQSRMTDQTARKPLHR